MHYKGTFEVFIDILTAQRQYKKKKLKTSAYFMDWYMDFVVVLRVFLRNILKVK